MDRNERAPASDLLGTLPEWVAAQIVDYLPLADVGALARTRRSAPAAASRVLCEEGGARLALVADGDMAKLLCRVGTENLCRAWHACPVRPYAALRAELRRRLPTTAPECAEGAVPFGIATCDAPGSMTIVLGLPGSNLAAPLNAAAGHVCPSPPADAADDDRHYRCRSAQEWSAMTAPGAPRLVVAGLTRTYPQYRAWLAEAADACCDGRSFVLGVSWAAETALPTLGRRVRSVVVDWFAYRSMRNVYPAPITRLCAHLDAPPTELERHALDDTLRDLRPYEWLVIDGWLRKWQVWSPPPVPTPVHP